MFKLDGGLDHILIDEAQDTNPAQWAIVKRLTDDFFQRPECVSDDVRRTVFAVGDEKQSIFGFQGARPQEFYAARAHFSAAITRRQLVDGTAAHVVPHRAERAALRR